jgi:hypothetical protein
MRLAPQPAFQAFVPRFLSLLFGPDDRFVVARLTARTGAKPLWDNASLPREQAIRQILSQPDAPNVYFRASAHDGSRLYAKVNCTRTRALFLDLDYGKAGHKAASPFASLDDAAGYLLTLPLRPSIAWHTGHGLQACFLLKEPYLFPPGGGAAESILRFEAVTGRLSKMAMSDSTFTPEHAFRVPLTINSKRHTDANLPDVRGELLWCDEKCVYAFEDIEITCAAYGAEEHLAETLAAQKAQAGPAEAQEVIQAEYADLPEELRQDIEARHPEHGITRHQAQYRIIGRMIRMGYDDTTIHNAMSKGPDFREKYERLLPVDITRCIGKLRLGHSVYPGTLAPTITIYNTPVPVPLADCAPLPPALDAMLSEYVDVTGATLGDRVRQAARFHEHLFQSTRSGILETPCGSGKSSWAIAHIALNARPDRRYVYVTETVDALYRAADTIAKLTDTPVGRVHGFNRDKCQELCGHLHNWWNCGATHPASVCHTCPARADCCYYTRQAEEQKPILCMTHSGLIRALEEDSKLLEDTCILVDEGLSPFNTATFTDAELDNLQKLVRVPLDLGSLFPYSRRAHAQELAVWQIPEDAETFARRNYVFRDEAQTAALAAVYNTLRARGALGLQQSDAFRPGDMDKGRETLAELANLFRPSRLNDATYAYREVRDQDGVRYSVTRNRFRFNEERRYRKLWVLNASALLSPYPYPENMSVYSCPDLPDSSHLLTVNVVRGNPTRSRQEANVRLSEIVLRLGPDMRQHRRILVATDKDEGARPEVERQIKAVHGDEAEIVYLTRGRIKGVNTAGQCSLAYLTGMATFTTVDDCALHAALLLRRTLPDQPYAYNRTGKPNWPGGKPYLPIMRNLYALRSLDELYQALWRTCIRNDKPAVAIIAVPDPYWLLALWRTVAPHFVMGTAYEETKTKVVRDERVPQADQRRQKAVICKVEMDDHMAGLCIVNMPPGTEITKKQVADQLGYTGDRAWEKNKAEIMQLLGYFFEDGSTNRMLRRK